jgi:hypothetical protein
MLQPVSVNIATAAQTCRKVILRSAATIHEMDGLSLDLSRVPPVEIGRRSVLRAPAQMRPWVLAAAVVLAAGCSAPAVCVPGASSSCTCADGGSGTETCQADKTPGACTCGGGTGGGSTSGDHYVFITTAIYRGNLGGLSGADTICTSAAQAGGLGGSWKAWLSDGTTNAIDRINDVGPWYLVGTSTKVFTDKANLMTQPLVEIRTTEKGMPVPVNGNHLVLSWTATQTGGTHGTSHCLSWTSQSFNDNGAYGLATPANEWTDASATIGCNQLLHLYCLQQ